VLFTTVITLYIDMKTLIFQMIFEFLFLLVFVFAVHLVTVLLRAGERYCRLKIANIFVLMPIPVDELLITFRAN